MQLRHLANRTPFVSSQTEQQKGELAHILRHESTSTAMLAPSSSTQSGPAGEPDSRRILHSIGDLVYEWNLVTDTLNWGPNLVDVLGPAAKGDLSCGMAYAERLSAESVMSRYEAIFGAETIDEGSGVAFKAVYALTAPREFGSHAPIWVEDVGRWFKGPDGRPLFAHGALRVITERYENERQLSLRSQFDPLTGALNRHHLNDHVQKFLTESERTRRSFAVMLVALENLFALNRNYGYDAGDEVISGLARRLRDNLRADDIVARHAGNKFALVLRDCDRDSCRIAAQRLLDAIASEPFATLAGPIPASIRIGGVIAPREGRTPRLLFQHAEEALDYARSRTGSRFVAYTLSLTRDDHRLRALQIADHIVSALNEGRVELAFQPIVIAETGEAAFYEALLRVRLADGAVIVPAEILPVAEKAGLVRLLDRRVLELALRRLAADPALNVSVNASLATVLDPDWSQYLSDAVKQRPDIAARLIVEITETSLIEDIEATQRVILACKALGVRVAMDDFGSGHTSFRNLRALSFDLVKIDGAFVENIVNSADDRFFVRTLIELAHHLSLKIVAEWVQDEETAVLLREWGVDYFQGSLYGKAGAKTGD